MHIDNVHSRSVTTSSWQRESSKQLHHHTDRNLLMMKQSNMLLDCNLTPTNATLDTQKQVNI